MRIVVTFAVDAEFVPWRRLRAFHAVSASSPAIYETEIAGAQICVVLTGMGKENAGQAMRAAFDAPADLCISAGLAGGLKPTHRVGEILVARQVAAGRQGPVVRSDEALRTTAADHGASVVDSFLSSDRLIRVSAEKRSLAAFADAVEMESYAVLSAAGARGVPAVAIRAISDPWDMDLSYDFERIVDAQGRLQITGLIGQILRRPHRLPALIRLGRQSRRAAARLAQFLDAFVGSLASQMSNYELDSPVAAT